MVTLPDIDDTDIASSGKTNATVHILGIGTHTPQAYSQQDILNILGYAGNRVAERIVKHAAIDSRSFYKTTLDFGADVSADELAEYHRHYAPLLAAEAVQKAAESAQIDVRELDAIITTSSTGFMSPGLAEVLYTTYHVGRANSQRYNLVGNGCVGTIPALQIARGLLLSGMARRVAVVCSEAVAALFNPHAEGTMTIVQQLIFGEGGAALILGVDDRCSNSVSSLHTYQHNGSVRPHTRATPPPRFSLLSTQHIIAPDSLEAIAIRQSTYWRSVTDKTIPDLVANVVPQIAQQLLEPHHLTVADIPYWAFHTGGRKILEQCQTSLGLSDTQMEPSYGVLLAHGNMLSASVLFSLDELIRTQTPQPGELGVLIALGPGLMAGASLLQW